MERGMGRGVGAVELRLATRDGELGDESEGTGVEGMSVERISVERISVEKMWLFVEGVWSCRVAEKGRTDWEGEIGVNVTGMVVPDAAFVCRDVESWGFGEERTGGGDSNAQKSEEKAGEFHRGDW